MLRRPVLLLLCSLLPALPVAAGEDAPSTPPSLGTLPAPDEAHAFHTRLAVLAEGRSVGKATLSAEAAPLADAPAAPAHWHVREVLEVGRGPERIRGRTEIDAWLDRQLVPVRGRWVEGVGPDALVYAFHRDGDAYAVEVTGAGRQPMTKRAVREGPCFLGVSSLVLLAREVPRKEATWSTRLFRPDWEYLRAEKPFVGVRIHLSGSTEEEHAAWRLDLEGETDARKTTVVLDATTRDVLRIRLVGPGAPAFELRPAEGGEGDPEPSAEDVPLDEPATTPLAAAMRTTLAFLTADADLFERVVYWPTLREREKGLVKGNVSDAAFRKAVLEQFRKNVPPPLEGDAARRRIQEAAGGFEVEPRGDDEAVVTLPPSIAPMHVTVARVDGTWYLVELPRG